MKKQYVVIGMLLQLLICLSTIPVWAVPTSSTHPTVTQPDGTAIEVSVKGDDWLSWIETEEGYTIVQDTETNQWLYVERYEGILPVLSSTPADQPPPPDLERHLRPEGNY